MTVPCHRGRSEDSPLWAFIEPNRCGPHFKSPWASMIIIKSLTAHVEKALQNMPS
jgi:hypothetical protein